MEPENKYTTVFGFVLQNYQPNYKKAFVFFTLKGKVYCQVSFWVFCTASNNSDATLNINTKFLIYKHIIELHLFVCLRIEGLVHSFMKLIV